MWLKIFFCTSPCHVDMSYTYICYSSLVRVYGTYNTYSSEEYLYETNGWLTSFENMTTLNPNNDIDNKHAIVQREVQLNRFQIHLL